MNINSLTQVSELSKERGLLQMRLRLLNDTGGLEKANIQVTDKGNVRYIEFVKTSTHADNSWNPISAPALIAVRDILAGEIKARLAACENELRLLGVEVD